MMKLSKEDNERMLLEMLRMKAILKADMKRSLVAIQMVKEQNEVRKN